MRARLLPCRPWAASAPNLTPCSRNTVCLRHGGMRPTTSFAPACSVAAAACPQPDPNLFRCCCVPPPAVASSAPLQASALHLLWCAPFSAPEPLRHRGSASPGQRAQSARSAPAAGARARARSGQARGAGCGGCGVRVRVGISQTRARETRRLGGGWRDLCFSAMLRDGNGAHACFKTTRRASQCEAVKMRRRPRSPYRQRGATGRHATCAAPLHNPAKAGTLFISRVPEAERAPTRHRPDAPPRRLTFLQAGFAGGAFTAAYTEEQGRRRGRRRACRKGAYRAAAACVSFRVE
eukprot:356312-Chlamydomonas_euryale.AAC.8